MVLDAEEKVLKRWLEMQEQYAKKRPFSYEPLEIKDFSDKYWLEGIAPYQYHAVRIQDGRNELEQLILNNIRALKNSLVKARDYYMSNEKKRNKENEELRKGLADAKKAVTICKLTSAVVAIISLSALCILRCQRNTRQKK